MNADELLREIDFACPKKMKAWLADFRKSHLRGWALNGGNVAVTDALGAFGKLFNARVIPAKGGGASAPKDFALYDASDSHGLKVGIKFGNVTASIDRGGVNPWPEEFTGSSTPPWTYTFAVSASGLAYLIVTVDPGDDTTAPKVTSISFGNDATLPADTSDTGYFTLGNWSVTGSGDRAKVAILTSEGIGSQGYVYCGGSHYFDPA